jgi:hypothetical protein
VPPNKSIKNEQAKKNEEIRGFAKRRYIKHTAMHSGSHGNYQKSDVIPRNLARRYNASSDCNVVGKRL